MGAVHVIQARALPIAAGIALSCGGGIDLVPTGPHRVDAQQLPVDEAPPPAKVERIPESPGDECRWLDGAWEQDAGSWEWRPGSWVVPPTDCYFAHSNTAWTTGIQGDRLYFRPGRWYPESASGTCGAPKRCETRRLIVDDR